MLLFLALAACSAALPDTGSIDVGYDLDRAAPTGAAQCWTEMHAPFAGDVVYADPDGDCSLLVWADLCYGDVIVVSSERGQWSDIHAKVDGEHRVRLTEPYPTRWRLLMGAPAHWEDDSFEVTCRVLPHGVEP